MPGFMETCEKAVRLSGRLLLERLGTVSVREKGPADLVTEADFASQDMVRKTVLEAFPDHILIGEEDPAALSRAGRRTAEEKPSYRWIVDPLDGTTNYVHQVPHFSVSLALEHEGQILVGAVYDPAADECFTAVAGEGAWLNGRQIRASRVTDLAHALCAIGFPAVTRRDSPELLLFLQALDRIQAFRRTGSASLNLCYVACGRYDVAWSFSTKIWDIAAGTLLIREAGGLVTSPDGGDLVLEEGRFLAAANERLHHQLGQLVLTAGVHL
jgi:myo-inositol-1(or 4)-monophosphatase